MPSPGVMEIAIPDLLSLKGGTGEVLEAADKFEIKTDEDLARGSGLIKLLQGLKKQVNNTFDGPIGKAKEALGSFRDAKKGHWDPLDQGEKKVKRQVDARYNELRIQKQKEEEEEQERVRKEKAAQEEEKRIREEKALAEAEAAENAGDAEQAQEILEKADKEPAPPPPVPAKPKTVIPKVEGIKQNTRWSAKLVSLKELAKAVGEGTAPLDSIQPNMVMLNSIARGAKKKDIGVPGVEGKSETGISGR